MLEDPVKDTFSYQIDIIIPNLDTNFNDLTDLFSSHEYYLLTEISLDKLIDPLFIEAFVKNGSIYMHSFNTKLDCDDCVCLLPNGTLILHLTPRTYERIPKEHKKISAKHSGLLKYEIQVDLTTNKHEHDELREIFKNYKYSFYVHWEPNNELKLKNLNFFETLKNYFGENNLSRCKNRFEKNSIRISSPKLIDRIFNKNDFELVENWKSMLNLCGCLINNINLETLFPNENSNEKIYVSIFRIKGFYPNRILNKMKEIFAKSYENEKLVCIFHGFNDSPVSLYDESVKLNQICRLNNENFFAVFMNNKNISEETAKEHFYYFYDFNKSFIEIK